MDLIKKLEEFGPRSSHSPGKALFADYFDIVKAKPPLAQLAHARILRHD